MKSELILFLGLCVINQIGRVDAFIGSTQSVAVVGRLFCKGNFTTQPWLVELWDRDTVDPDDKMGETESLTHGSFYVEGYETEMSTIDPEIRIFHTCSGGERKCFKMDVPDDYIAKGKHATRVYDAGTIQLDKVQANC